MWHHSPKLCTLNNYCFGELPSHKIIKFQIKALSLSGRLFMLCAVFRMLKAAVSSAIGETVEY